VATPAAVRFLSVEPMLEAIDLAPKLGWLDWLIVGGESGVGDLSRPVYPEWVRDLRDQARAVGGAFLLKQVGSHALWPGAKGRPTRASCAKSWESPVRWLATWLRPRVAASTRIAR